VEITVKVPGGAERVSVVGSAERNLKMIREGLGVGVTAREGRVHLSGNRGAVVAARRVIERLAEASHIEPLDRQQVLDLIAEESGQSSAVEHPWGGNGEHAVGVEPQEWDGRLNVYSGGKAVRPRTAHQEHYLSAIRENDLVFAIGPAGTGKTYLAVAAAVHLLKTGRVRRVVLARPAVEAGEKLGFLPGDLREKVNPYLRPLFDALNDMMDYQTVRRFIDSDVVEICPLAFMRGRTLNNAAIILDEAQNTTKGQMKMFLTRMGQGSKMVVTGDVTQIDLPEPADSGLIDAARRLGRTKGVAFVSFDRTDVVRHELVQRVIDAYGEEDEAPNPPTPRKSPGRTRKPGQTPPDNLGIETPTPPMN
jgi:phosphate starvation-inducible protein PhoH and related proteins